LSFSSGCFDRHVDDAIVLMSSIIQTPILPGKVSSLEPDACARK